MVPHFFSMERVNYSRWLPVYLSDMHMLQLTHPAVHQEFIAGNHSVSRSNQPFAQVWPDMAETFTIGLLSDPFQIPEEISEVEIPLTLINLATGQLFFQAQREAFFSTQKS